MRGCLQCLGRPLPTTKLDLIASLFWSMLRQLVHRAGFCHLVERNAVSLWRSSSDHDIKLSARDAAVVYHKLLQLHLTGSMLSPFPSICPSVHLTGSMLSFSVQFLPSVHPCGPAVYADALFVCQFICPLTNVSKS